MSFAAIWQQVEVKNGLSFPIVLKGATGNPNHIAIDCGNMKLWSLSELFVVPQCEFRPIRIVVANLSL